MKIRIAFSLFCAAVALPCLQSQTVPPEGFSTVSAALNANTEGSTYGQQPSLVLDANGDPVVIFFDQDPNSDNDYSDAAIYFTAWSRTLGRFPAARKLFITGDVPVKGSIRSAGLARDSSNNALGIVYQTKYSKEAVGALHLAFSTDGGITWKDQTVATDQSQFFEGVSLAMASGKFYVSYVLTNNGVRYVTGLQSDAPAKWTTQSMPKIPGFGDSASVSSLALDSSGAPAIVSTLFLDTDYGVGLFFWRPGSAPVLAADTRGHSNDEPEIRLSFFGTQPRIVFGGAFDDQFFDSHQVASLYSADSGKTWSRFTLVPEDRGDSFDPALSVATGSKGQAAIVGTSNGSDGSGICGTPKLARSSDFINWTTCGLAPRNMPSFSGLNPAVVFDSNDRLVVVFSVAAGSDLTAGVGLWKEPSPVGTVPLISAGGIGNAASFLPPVAPGSLATIFGSNFTAGAAQNASSLPLPTTLSGASVMVNGQAVPLVYVGTTQINFQVPYETTLGTATVMVTTGTRGNSQTASMQVVATAPGIFVFGANRSVVQNQDYQVNQTSVPAKVGSTVIAYLTGSGTVTNQPRSGAAASSTVLSYVTASPISAVIGTTSAPVVFAGLAPGFVGLLQMNITIPNLATGDYPLTVTLGGATSNGPLISVLK